MRTAISLRYRSIAFVVVSTALSMSAFSQTSEIGLYPPDLRAIRQMSSPTGSLSLPSGDEAAGIAKAWGRISKKGREFLLREPGLALVTVDSSGKWLYRSTGITTLRVVYNPGEALRRQDADDLGAVLNSYWCRQLRDFYERMLFSTGPYSAGSTRSIGSLVAMAYGSFLAEVESGSGRNEDKEWFSRIVGYEMRGLDENTREGLLRDPTYGAEIASAKAAAEETRRRQLESVAAASSSGSPPQVNFPDIAFVLPQRPGEAERFGRFEVTSLHGRELLSWSTPSVAIFMLAVKDLKHLPSYFTEENLRELLKDDKVKAYVASPGAPQIFELKLRP